MARKARNGKTANPVAKKTSTSLDANLVVPTPSVLGPPGQKTQQELEDENAELRRQVERLNDQVMSRKPPVHVIPKPKGQAGRGNGYNLFDEMHLSSNTAYNMIRNVVRGTGTAYLDIRLTWGKQDQKAKDLARKEIKRLAPIMKYYHHAWPIDAFLKQYLGSSAAKYRKDLQQLVALDEVPSLQEAATSKGADQDAEDFVSFSNDDSDSDEESDANLEMVDTVTKSTDKGKEASNRNQAIVQPRETRTGKKENAQVNNKSEACSTKKVKPLTKTTEGAKKSLPANKGNKNINSTKRPVPLLDMTEEIENRPAKRTRSSQKKQDADKPSDDQSAKTRKRKSDDGVESRPAKKTRKNQKDIEPIAETGWPSVCPDEFCDDVFPPLPSKRLATTYKTYLAQKTHMNALLVCVQIQNDQKLPDLQKVALKNKWPTIIDFQSLAKRIEKHRGEFSGLFTNEIVISASAAWKMVIRTLASHNITFSTFNGYDDQKKFLILHPVAHGGYYGPRGVEIIRAAIYSTLFGKDQMEIVGNLQVALADVFENHQDSTIALAGFWDSANGLSISLTNFIEFVVTPHIANLLIQDDLQITEDKANGHRLRSKDIGDAFQYSHGNDDENEEASGHLQNISHPLIEDSNLSNPALTVAKPSNNPTSVVPTLKIPARPKPRPPTGTGKGTKRGKGTASIKQLNMSDFPPPVVRTS